MRERERERESKKRANWGGFVEVFYDLLADGHILFIARFGRVCKRYYVVVANFVGDDICCCTISSII